MSNLTEARLAISQPPFTNTGNIILDLSPLNKEDVHVQQMELLIGTCAVHNQLVGDLSTDTFILALRRFISRRGHPKNIFSDNETNFTGSQRELAKSLKCLDQDIIEAELTLQKINRNFSPPVSSWINGAMETIVKITKKHLSTIISNYLFNE